MRRLLVALLLAVSACANPSPSAPSLSPSAHEASAEPISSGTTSPTETPDPSYTSFGFDVENHSSVGVAIRADGDTAYVMAWLALEAGQGGTATMSLGYPQLGVYVEVQGVREAACSVLVPSVHLAAVPFTLVIEDGPGAGTVTVSTRAGASATPLPQPSNTLGGCPG
jgi:hypothetical protein